MSGRGLGGPFVLLGHDARDDPRRTGRASRGVVLLPSLVRLHVCAAAARMNIVRWARVNDGAAYTGATLINPPSGRHRRAASASGTAEVAGPTPPTPTPGSKGPTRGAHLGGTVAVAALRGRPRASWRSISRVSPPGTSGSGGASAPAGRAVRPALRPATAGCGRLVHGSSCRTTPEGSALAGAPSRCATTTLPGADVRVPEGVARFGRLAARWASDGGGSVTDARRDYGGRRGRTSGAPEGRPLVRGLSGPVLAPFVRARAGRALRARAPPRAGRAI